MISDLRKNARWSLNLLVTSTKENIMDEAKDNYHKEIAFHKSKLKHFTKLQDVIDSKEARVKLIESVKCEDNYTRRYAHTLKTKPTTENDRYEIARNIIRVKRNPFLIYKKRGEALAMARMSINRVLLETLK